MKNTRLEHFALTFHRCWESIPNPTPLPSARLRCAWAFVHVKEYARVVCALDLNTPTTPFNETTRIFHLLHPLIEVDLPLFVDDFHPKTEVILN